MDQLKYIRNDYEIDKIDPHWADYKIAAMIPNNRTVLEIGCSNGYMGKFLKEKLGCTVTGIELREFAAESSFEYYEDVIIGDIKDIEVLNKIKKTYDIILCSNVLEHLEHPEQTLLNLKKYLNPYGSFIVALPNVAHWSVRLKLLFGNFDYTPLGGILDNEHLHFYTLKSITRLFAKTGFHIQYWDYDYDNGLPILNSILSRIPRIGNFLSRIIYSFSPELFGYQFIFKAYPSTNQCC